ncbi:MAG: hypothetical protein ACLGXA_07955 [Acidobacteriota bacterium]
MRTRIFVAGVVGLVAVLALLGGGTWYLVNHRQAKVCPFSGRMIHAQTRALVTIGGQRYETCCVRCAIIEAQQTGKPLRVLKVADCETGKLIDPAGAWFVESSDVNLCMRMSPAAESPGRESVYVRAFDRCSPSALAFRNEQEAHAFMAQHGGALKRLDDLQQEATTTVPKVQTP